MSVTSELSRLTSLHQLLGGSKARLLEKLENMPFTNDEIKAFVLALADYTHDPRAVNLLNNLFDEGIDKWAIGQPCPERFISKPNPNPSIVFEARPIIGVEPVTLILNVGLEDYTPTAETHIDDLEYVVIPTDN